MAAVGRESRRRQHLQGEEDGARKRGRSSEGSRRRQTVAAREERNRRGAAVSVAREAGEDEDPVGEENLL